MLLIAASLAACSGSAPPIAQEAPANAPAGSRILPREAELAPMHHLHLTPASITKGLKHVFLADAALNTITVFSGTGTHTITGFQEPQGITSDAAGTLYVADTVNERIQEFVPPYPNNASATLKTPGEWPVDAAVAKSGLVAAIIICKAAGSQCGGPGSVEIFANNHASSPCASVSGGTKISRLLWGGFDAAGSLYVAGVDHYTTAVVGVVAGGCAATSLKVLKPNVAVNFVSGIQVDKSGRVAILDSQGAYGTPRLDLFAAPKPGSSKLKLIVQNFLNDSGVVVSFALSKDNTKLFTAEPHYSLEYNYPNAGFEIGVFSPGSNGGDLIEGVAVTPASVP
jgi:hypothetical protein